MSHITTTPLAIVRQFDERDARIRRVDSFAVNRSCVKTAKALPPTPPEAQRAEEILRPIRLAATLADRVQVWRTWLPGLR